MLFMVYFGLIFVGTATKWPMYQVLVIQLSIWTVSSQRLLPALPNWLKLVYEPFGQSNMHHTLDFGPDQARKKSMYQS